MDIDVANVDGSGERRLTTSPAMEMLPAWSAADRIAFVRLPEKTFEAAAIFAVDADGTHATADIAIAGAAPPGARVVQIMTPLRASSPAGTGGNVFTLQ